ncbi:hypothetical protein [uncultured Lamprocystis sp.]|jgi:uncharacterized phage-associated protein|uniref:hypothetical protein n=1 Tax=uncultured Lamprocystis sp. TaxID=543132 RepID=UPI0025ECAFBB|nr:hypothetical protein [uncultured Lamprocystis sp.]
MLTARDVAQFFIMKGLDDEESGISNLKLQKLLYYAKGFHQAIGLDRRSGHLGAPGA